jgi:lipopolysaccharide export system permease protein
MNRITIIDRYIFLELISPFVISLGFFTFVFLMAEMLKITDLIVNYGVSLLVIAQILLFSIPYFLTYIIPMATMMAVLLTLLRMTGDNEIIALKSAGVSLYRLLAPILAFCLLAVLLAYAMAVYGTPIGRQAIKSLTFKVFSSNLDIGLKERTFSDSFSDVMLYVNEIDIKNRELIDVFVEDKRDERMTSTVIAPRGKLLSEPDSLVFHLRLYDGMVNQVDRENRSANSVSFDTYNVRLDLKKAATAASSQKGRKEMSLSELRRFIQTAPNKDLQYYKALMEYYKKFAIPLACLSLGILAVPLGTQSRRGGRSSGLVLGLLFFLLYYVLLSTGMVFGENGSYPPVIGMWVPDIVMAALGLFLLVRAAREQPVKLELIFKHVTLRRSAQA